MITSRRDYILRIIDEVTQLLARLIFKRKAGADHEALEIVIQGCERLFSLERDKLFQFTPEQHFAMLTEQEPVEIARDKVLLYAALNAEAGKIYTKLGNRELARATFTNALRFALKSRAIPSAEPRPKYAPEIDEIVDALGIETLDPETRSLLKR